jgi:hypothetical protein
MSEQAPTAATEAQDTRVAVVLAIAAIVAAALAAWATLLTGSADDHWQRAIRSEVRVSANVVNDTITAYDQVPLAEATIEHRFAAAELAKTGAPLMRTTFPAVYVNWFLENGEQELKPNEAPWVRSDGSFDVAGRIAALRGRETEGVPPPTLRAQGDADAHRAWLVGLAILPAAVGFLAAATARAFPRVRAPALAVALALVLLAIVAALIGGTS